MSDQQNLDAIGMPFAELLGIKITSAAPERVTDALEILARESFDVILMDVQMPDMDGLETTRAIRGREQPGFRRTPIAALTAHTMTGDRERCLAAGMDDYLSKPIRLAALGKTLERWLEPKETLAP